MIGQPYLDRTAKNGQQVKQLKSLGCTYENKTGILWKIKITANDLAHHRFQAQSCQFLMLLLLQETHSHR
jgi:hypothetical protein